MTGWGNRVERDAIVVATRKRDLLCISSDQKNLTWLPVCASSHAYIHVAHMCRHRLERLKAFTHIPEKHFFTPQV